jgi:hypothetical protein
MASLSSTADLIWGCLMAAFACILLFGFYLRWQSRQIYKRIGNYSIGYVTFEFQLQQPGVNFPGPNVLEAQIAAQPDDVKADIEIYRRRSRYFRWAGISFVGALVVFGVVVTLVRKLNV